MSELWFLIIITLNGTTYITQPSKEACEVQREKLAKSPMGIRTVCISGLNVTSKP